MLRGDQSPGDGELDVGPDVCRPLACRAVHLAPRLAVHIVNMLRFAFLAHLTFLALHAAVAVLAVLAVVTPVPRQTVAVSLESLASVTVETAHPALDSN